jgi:hypothetical protein
MKSRPRTVAIYELYDDVAHAIQLTRSYKFTDGKIDQLERTIRLLFNEFCNGGEVIANFLRDGRKSDRFACLIGSLVDYVIDGKID